MSMQFNEEYYLENNTDVADAVAAGDLDSGKQHWELFGAKEGRNPNAVFNTAEYLEANEDVADSGMNPLQHFLQFGAAEGRAPSASYAAVAEGFDADEYLEANEDVAAAVESGDFASAYQHWVLFGQFEDDRGDVTFDGGTPVEDVITDNVEEDNGDDGDDQGVPGETFDLTVSADDITGTADNDVFDAGIGQNANGQIVNTLSSADEINGGAGNDTLNASLSQEAGIGGETLNVQPTTSDVENINIEARSSNAGGEANPAGTVNLDAKDMTGVNFFGSDYSDGDLVIQNVNTLDDEGNLRNTSDITVSMDHTSNFDSIGDASDLTVLFDDDYLLAGSNNTVSQANYWLLDEDSELADGTPLLNIERNGVALEIDGETVIIAADKDAAAAADTYEAYASVLQARVDEMVANGNKTLEGITVEVDENNLDDTFNDAGENVKIPAITLFDSKGRDLNPTGFVSPEDATGNFDIYGRFDNVPSETIDQPVSVNVELEKVGRAGEGGNLVVGGKSQQIVDGQANGIEVFNIDVLGDAAKPSNLGSITSTNGQLETINIATGAEFAGNDSLASLTIRGADENNDASNPFGENVDMINAAAFEGDLTIGTEGVVESYAQNVDTVNAVGGGDVTFNGNYDEAGTYVIATGAGDDVINLEGDQAVTVSTGEGDDIINGGAVSVDVKAGAGNDAVYVDNTGETGAIEAFDTSALAQGSEATPYGLLAGRTVTVTVNGFDATAVVQSNNLSDFSSLTNQDDLNDAIIQAVADSEVLSDLVEVEVVNGELQFTSKIDGANNNVEIGVGESNWSDSELDALESEYRDANSDSSLTVGEQGEVVTEETLLEGGADSVADNTNTVRLGGGEDTVVLSSAEGVSDTIVFDGNFGTASIVNFTGDEDQLDFSAYLDGMQSASGSDESAVRIDTTYQSDMTLSANEVNTQTFAGNDVVESFDDLTAGNLLEVFDFSTEGYTNTNSNVQLVDGDGSSIVMVQNDENPGEYKVFDVTFDGTNEDFELSAGNVSMIGTADFGADLDGIGGDNGGDNGGDTGTEILVDQNLTAEDGVAETFVYNIDSSGSNVISLATGDWTVDGFTEGEDSVVFQDVDGGTVTAADFAADAASPTVSGSTINNQVDFLFDDNQDGIAHAFTVTGVSTGEAVDYSIA